MGKKGSEEGKPIQGTVGRIVKVAIKLLLTGSCGQKMGELQKVGTPKK